MAYESSIKLEAENLYHRGYNLNQITEMLRKKHPTVSYKTVEKWAKAKDKSGKTWEDYRNQIMTNAREIAHQSVANKYALMKEKASIMRENIEQALLGGKLEIKSPEGAIYAWKALAEFEFMIEDKYEKKKTPKEIVLEFLDILNTVPQIQVVLKKNWNLVEEELKRRIEEGFK